MQCNFDIDYFKKTLAIDRKLNTYSTEVNHSTIKIDRIVSSWLLEKQSSTVLIDKEKFRTIPIYIPYFTDWVNLQNEYLPYLGEYFLN